MLIVFLAVPALQRNSRNRGRENDASLLATAVSDCVTNKNGSTTNCQTINTNNVSYDTSKSNQLTSTPAYGNLSSANETTARWQFKQSCTDGAPTASSRDRDFAVTFKVETAQGTTIRCITA